MKVKHHSSGFSREQHTGRCIRYKPDPLRGDPVVVFFLKRFSRLIHKIVKGCIELAKLTSYITYVRLRLRGMVVFYGHRETPKESSM